METEHPRWGLILSVTPTKNIKASVSVVTVLALFLVKLKLSQNDHCNLTGFYILGPKVNHHFRANNSVYMETEHPRWGLIQSVTPTKNIKAGEELFTYYGYGASEFPNDFPWYFGMFHCISR